MSLKKFNSVYCFRMYYKQLLFFVLGTVALGIIACSQSLYMPTHDDSQSSGIATDTLLLGRKLYVRNCASCHSLYLPQHYTVAEWKNIIPQMQERAKCNDAETELITKYLTARAKSE